MVQFAYYSFAYYFALVHAHAILQFTGEADNIPMTKQPQASAIKLTKPNKACFPLILSYKRTRLWLDVNINVCVCNTNRRA